MSYHPGAYLDELELYASKRPVRHLARQGEPAQEVSEVVREDKQSEPHLVGEEASAGEPCPCEGILPFLDMLLTYPPLVVEPDYVLGSSAHIGHDETDAGEQLACVPFHLGYDPPRFGPRCRPA